MCDNDPTNTPWITSVQDALLFASFPPVSHHYPWHVDFHSNMGLIINSVLFLHTLFLTKWGEQNMHIKSIKVLRRLYVDITWLSRCRMTIAKTVGRTSDQSVRLTSCLLFCICSWEVSVNKNRTRTKMQRCIICSLAMDQTNWTMTQCCAAQFSTTVFFNPTQLIKTNGSLSGFSRAWWRADHLKHV